MGNVEQLRSLITDTLGNLVDSSRVECQAVLVYVQPQDIRELLELLRDSEHTRFDVMSVMTATDYSPRQPRFELMYELYSTVNHHRVRVKVCLEHTGGEYDLPEIDTVSDIYLTANWHERECYDLMGINFKGHPDLRRIVLPDGWDGHPLRKEYPYDGKRAWQPATSVESAVRSDVNPGLEQG